MVFIIVAVESTCLEFDSFNPESSLRFSIFLDSRDERVGGLGLNTSLYHIIELSVHFIYRQKWN